MRTSKRKNYSPLQVDKGGHFVALYFDFYFAVKALVFTACAKENAEVKICWVGFETGRIVICEYLVLYTQSFMQKVQTKIQ